MSDAAMRDVVAALRGQWEPLLPGLLGVEVLEALPERVTARMQVRPDLCTLGGVLHGGAVMAFADTLGAVATILNLPSDARTTTVESKTNFLGAAPAGSVVLAETVPVHRGRTTMVWQTYVRSEAGKLIALVIQTQLVLSGK
jgi:1,4-dihydroxy-2-naphthoyl-CoA hydrolase